MGIKEKLLWDLASFIKISQNHKKILELLSKKPYFPSELVVDLNISFSTVSTNLRLLEEKNLVICLNPDRRKGKFFILSPIGEEVFQILRNLD